jgi:LmbE family N-acetylglucosaminyl deacetylase
MGDETLRILAVGAHPDDCDLKMGGIACEYTDCGHNVQFVSMTNGAAGHHEQGGAPLVRRRQAEAEAAAKVANIELTLFDNTDGRLQPSLANRDQLIHLV